MLISNMRCALVKLTIFAANAAVKIHYYFFLLNINTAIRTITNTTRKIPKPIPALKMPPMASQELNNNMDKHARKTALVFM